MTSPFTSRQTLAQGVFTLASGFARNSVEIIVFRAALGVSQSLILPASVRVINDTSTPGRLCNMAFASMGGGQPVGFALGLVLGGVFSATWGWRRGLYLVAGLTFGVVLFTSWGLQAPPKVNDDTSMWRKLRDEINWVGITIASAFLGMIGCVMALVVPPQVCTMTYLICSKTF